MDAENAAEMARLSKLAKHLTKGIGLVPSVFDLTSCREILDIGCGPGEWAMEIARLSPSSRVSGIDVSTLMIAYAQFCAQTEGIPNTHFRQADARQSLPFPDATFDLVHARLASAWLNTSTWPAVLEDYYRVLKSKGKVCCTEYENLGITTSAALTRYNMLCMRALHQTRQCFSPDGDHSGVTVMLPSLLQEAGFQEIHLEAHAVPYSFGTPGYLSMIENLTMGLQLIQPFLLAQGVATQQELSSLYEQTVLDMRANRFRAMVYYLRIWGEK
ncbi:MAG: class I SAM-dependent methyltransferase [Ktedonobacteraceae bacterium]